MGTAGIIKYGMIVFGSATVLLGIWLLALKKLTADFATVWELAGILLIAAGAVPALSGWLAGKLGIAGGIFLGIVFLVLLTGMCFSLLFSRIIIKNKELAILVSMLLWENEK